MIRLNVVFEQTFVRCMNEQFFKSIDFTSTDQTRVTGSDNRMLETHQI